nr:hypothetical protein Iba_chr04dCG5610 [Ipomoea batatas]
MESLWTMKAAFGRELFLFLGYFASDLFLRLRSTSFADWEVEYTQMRRSVDYVRTLCDTLGLETEKNRITETRKAARSRTSRSSMISPCSVKSRSLVYRSPPPLSDSDTGAMDGDSGAILFELRYEKRKSTKSGIRGHCEVELLGTIRELDGNSGGSRPTRAIISLLNNHATWPQIPGSDFLTAIAHWLRV